jgi:hypothetical protein
MEGATKLLTRRLGAAAPAVQALAGQAREVAGQPLAGKPLKPAAQLNQAGLISSASSSLAGVLAGISGPGRFRSTSASPGGVAGTFITYLFYLSAAVFFIFLLLTFVHFTVRPIFSLTAGDKGILGIGTNEDKQSAWTDKPPTNKQPTTLLNPKSCDYTISFDVYVPTEYKAITAPRVFLYRSDTEIILAAGTVTAATGAAAATAATAPTPTLLSTFPTTNLLAYIDPSKNDLNIYAVTDKGQESVPPITNIPLGKAFRLSIAFMPNYIEVYIDGKLNATKVLQGIPVKTTAQFWGPPSSVSSVVQIGTFYYWPRALKASELQALISQSADFFTKT